MNPNRINFEPSIWGPYAWTFLHTIAMSYPVNPSQEERNNMRRFLESLGEVLPCESCSNNYKNYIKKVNIDVSNRENLVKWMQALQNDVRIRNKKRPFSPNEFMDYYKSLYAEKKEGNITQSLLKVVVLISVIVLITHFTSSSVTSS